MAAERAEARAARESLMLHSQPGGWDLFSVLDRPLFIVRSEDVAFSLSLSFSKFQS